MEEIFSAWAMLGLQCSSCRRKNEMPIWPLVPLAFVALPLSVLLALQLACIREARRLGAYPILVLLLLTLPSVILSVLSLLVLFIAALLLKLVFFVLLLGWRRSCWFCKERKLAINNFGMADFVTVLRGAWKAEFGRTMMSRLAREGTEAMSGALHQNIVVLQGFLGASLQSLAGLHKYLNSKLIEKDMGPLELSFGGDVLTLTANNWGSVGAAQEALQIPEPFEANRLARYEWQRVDIGTDPGFGKMLGKRLVKVEAITPVSVAGKLKFVLGWVLRFEDNEYIAYFNSRGDGHYLASVLPPTIGGTEIETCQIEDIEVTGVKE